MQQETTRYIVAARVDSSGKKEQNCMVVEEDAIIIGTHRKVYGPASREECEQWKAENCES
jgi:hypothetical protein